MESNLIKNNMTTSYLQIILIGAFLCCSLLIFACQAPPDSQGELEPITLQLKSDPQFQAAGYYAALEQGYYEEAGLDVTIVPGEPHNTVSKVVNGEAQ